METDKFEAVSAGGVVARVYHGIVEILLLRDTRYKDWTLPKGHVETDETLTQAALREIREEAGVIEAKVVTKLGSFRRFVEKAQEWKTIHYFLIVAQDNEPKGILESEYMETRWFNPNNLPGMYLPEQEDLIKDNLKKIERLMKI